VATVDDENLVEVVGRIAAFTALNGRSPTTSPTHGGGVGQVRGSPPVVFREVPVDQSGLQIRLGDLGDPSARVRLSIHAMTTPLE
jgi:hypothetical protein